MENTYYLLETNFLENIKDMYQFYNKNLSELYKRPIIDTIYEKRNIIEINELLKNVDISKEEFTRVALIFKRYSKVIFLVDYFEPLGKSIHQYLGHKYPRRCNIIFTYEIINSTIEDILSLKYNISTKEFKNSIIIVPNTSSNYYNIIRNLRKSKLYEHHQVIFLVPKIEENQVEETDYVFKRGFLASAIEDYQKIKLTYLV